MRKTIPGILLPLVLLIAAHAPAQTNTLNGLPVLPAQAVSSPTPETVVYASTDSLDDKRKLTIGDRVSYRVLEDKNPAVSLLVTDAGDIEAPLLGRVAAAGKTCRELAYEVKPVLEKTYFYKATVIVALDMATLKSPGRVYVSGLVAAPGPQDIPPDEVYTLSKAITRAGGVAQFGNGHRVKIVRRQPDGSTQSINADVAEIIDKGRIDKDPVLQPNDLIVVPRKLINFLNKMPSHSKNDAEPRHIDAFALRNNLRKWTVQWRQRWWLVLLIVAVGAFAGAVWAFRQPPAYLSTARMVMAGKITVPNGATYSEELTYFLGTQAEFMKSGEVRRRAAQQVASTDPELIPAPVALEVGRDQTTSIFNLSAVGPSGAYTQKYLEAVMSEYGALKRQMRSEKSDDTEVAITEELTRLEAGIAQGQAEMIDFEKNNNVGFLQEQSNSAAEYLVTLNRSLANLKNEYQLLQSLDLDKGLDRSQKHELMEMAQKDRAAAAAQPRDDPSGMDSAKSEAAEAGDTGSEGDIQKAEQDLQALVAQRDSFVKVLRPQHPTMIDLNQKIDDQKRLIESLRNQGLDEMKTREESLRLEIDNLNKTITEWEAKAVDVGIRMTDYNRIKDKVDRAQEAYRQQSTNLTDIELNKNVDQDMISVLEHATDPISVQPGLWRSAGLMAGGGLLLGLAVLAVLAHFDDRILTTTDLESVFKEQLLAQIPRVGGAGARGGADALSLLGENDERHAFAESLRSLRSSLVFLPALGAAPRSFLVTSAVPDEGKSTVAANLAVTFAFAGATVLLIDGDLRRGELHALFGLENGRGFADVLADERHGKWREAVKLTRTPGLSLLPRGNLIRNPGENFLKRGTNHLLAEMYAVYDYVIIDSAPVMVADDTTSLAPKIDATLFVVRYGSSSTRTSRKALDLLHRRQANVLGLVCNDVEVSAQEYYYYRYPEYYGPVAETRSA